MSIRQAIDGLCPPALLGLKRRVATSSLAIRLARGTFWSFAGSILSRLLGVLASILVARIISKVGMGQLGIVQSTVGMFSVFAGLGLGLAATKHVAEHRATNPALIGETIGLLNLVSWLSGSVMTLVVFLLAPWLARHMIAAPELAPELRVGTWLLLFGVINGVQTGVLSGFEAFKSIARINLICGLANFPILVCGAYLAGLAGAVWGLVAIQALNCGLNFLTVRREASAAGVVVTYWHVHKHRNLLWQFGLPGMLSGLVSGPANWITSTMLVNQPQGYAEMGILNVTNNWFQAAVYLPNILGQVLLPVLAGYTAAKDRARLNRVLALATGANFLLVLPLITLVCFFSRQIMGFYGPGFADGWPVMVLVMVNAAVVVIHTPLTDQLVATSRMWVYFSANIVWAVIYTPLTWFLASAYGAAGLSTARIAGFIASGLFIVWHICNGKRV